MIVVRMTLQRHDYNVILCDVGGLLQSGLAQVCVFAPASNSEITVSGLCGVMLNKLEFRQDVYKLSNVRHGLAVLTGARSFSRDLPQCLQRTSNRSILPSYNSSRSFELYSEPSDDSAQSSAHA